MQCTLHSKSRFWLHSHETLRLHDRRYNSGLGGTNRDDASGGFWLQVYSLAFVVDENEETPYSLGVDLCCFVYASQIMHQVPHLSSETSVF